MRIKEVEEKLGISSRTIRFYEKEGLLIPNRSYENGYRDYSDEDVRRLEKVKLFRKLGISIEDIRLLQLEKLSLGDVLKKQEMCLKMQIQDLVEAKSLCSDIESSNISYKDLDEAEWLSKIDDLERKGMRFTNIDDKEDVSRFLPDKFKMRYYESLIKDGEVENGLLGEIIGYILEIYKESKDSEEVLINALSKLEMSERNKLLKMIKENSLELYDKVSKNIFEFEDIVNLDRDKVKETLNDFHSVAIVKASMGASPKVNEYLQSLFPLIDLAKERQFIGRIPISEIISVHNEIVEAINRKRTE